MCGKIMKPKLLYGKGGGKDHYLEVILQLTGMIDSSYIFIRKKTLMPIRDSGIAELNNIPKHI